MANPVGILVDRFVGRCQPLLVHHAPQNEVAAQIPVEKFLLVNLRIRVADVDRGMESPSILRQPDLFAVRMHHRRRVRAVGIVQDGALDIGQIVGPLGRRAVVAADFGRCSLAARRR